MTVEWQAAVGRYPHTEALRSGAIASEKLRLVFAEMPTINRAFAPMVRDARFDVSEMAIATFLQAKAFGKPLVLLPVTVAEDVNWFSVAPLPISPIRPPMLAAMVLPELLPVTTPLTLSLL